MSRITTVFIKVFQNNVFPGFIFNEFCRLWPKEIRLLLNLKKLINKQFIKHLNFFKKYLATKIKVNVIFKLAKKNCLNEKNPQPLNRTRLEKNKIFFVNKV